MLPCSRFIVRGWRVGATRSFTSRCTNAFFSSTRSLRDDDNGVDQGEEQAKLRARAKRKKAAWQRFLSSNADARLTQTSFAPKSLPGHTLQLAWGKKGMLIRTPSIRDGIPTGFWPAAMRDGCACPRCRDPVSGQKNFSSPEVPADIGFKDVRATDEGLIITYDHEIERFHVVNDEHQTVFPWEDVGRLLRGDPLKENKRPTWPSIVNRTGVRYWDRDILSKSIQKIDFNDYMQDDKGLYRAILELCRLGVVMIKNVPQDEDSIIKVTTRIANIQETFYGRTFDVRAKPDADNIAYTSGHLAMHQDLLYLNSPPKIQILHCLENSCEGGDSLFGDAERVAGLLVPFLNRHSMSPLNSALVEYKYDKNGYRYSNQREAIRLYHSNDGRPPLARAYWSPPFQGTFTPKWNMKKWLSATKVFEDLLNAESAVYRTGMESGDCVLFDNMRVMHGRTAFDAAGGSRWLRGAYISMEDFLSKAYHIPDSLLGQTLSPPYDTIHRQQQALKDSSWHEQVWTKIQEMESRSE